MRQAQIPPTGLEIFIRIDVFTQYIPKNLCNTCVGVIYKSWGKIDKFVFIELKRNNYEI